VRQQDWDGFQGVARPAAEAVAAPHQQRPKLRRCLPPQHPKCCWHLENAHSSSKYPARWQGDSSRCVVESAAAQQLLVVFCAAACAAGGPKMRKWYGQESNNVPRDGGEQPQVCQNSGHHWPRAVGLWPSPPSLLGARYAPSSHAASIVAQPLPEQEQEPEQEQQQQQASAVPQVDAYDGPRDVILVTDADTPTGELVTLQLILLRCNPQLLRQITCLPPGQPELPVCQRSRLSAAVPACQQRVWPGHVLLWHTHMCAPSPLQVWV
jgi:hypothetical protein